MFIDDDRDAPSSDWVIVRNQSWFSIEMHERGFPEHISFDYYLSNENADDLLNLMRVKLAHGLWEMPNNFTFEVHTSSRSKGLHLEARMNKIIQKYRTLQRLNSKIQELEAQEAQEAQEHLKKHDKELIGEYRKVLRREAQELLKI